MSLPIILLCGQAGVGKSTIADAMAKSFNCSTIALAHPIKEFAHDFLRISKNSLLGPSSERGKKVDLTRMKEDDLYNSEAWADYVGINASAMYNLWTAVHSVKEPTVRKVLQEIGDFGRSQDKNLWVNRALKTANRILDEGCRYTPLGGCQDEKLKTLPSFVVIEDGRYPNEVLGIRRAGGIVVKIQRYGVESVSNHSSEKSLETIPDSWYNHIVENDDQAKMVAGRVIGAINKNLWIRSRY